MHWLHPERGVSMCICKGGVAAAFLANALHTMPAAAAAPDINGELTAGVWTSNRLLDHRSGVSVAKTVVTSLLLTRWIHEL